MQIFLKRKLRTLLTDLGVGCVAHVRDVLFVLRIAYPVDVAEDVGGVLRIVLAHIRFLDAHARDVVFENFGDKLHVGVLDKDIVRGIYEVADVHRIAHGDYRPRLLCGVVRVDLVPCAHIGQHLDGAGVCIELAVFLVLVEPRLIDGGHLRIFKGRLCGDGQIVHKIVTVLTHHIYKLKYDLV